MTYDKSDYLSTTEDNDDEESDGIIFKLKKWNHVMIWSWDVNEDTCAICNISITDSCPRVSRYQQFRVSEVTNINPSRDIKCLVSG